MTDSVEAARAQLARLRQEYARTLLDKIAQLETNWQALLSGPWDHDEQVRVQRLVHNLAGSGATFGFTELSAVACKLELYLQSLGAMGGPPEGEAQATVTRALTALRAAAQVGPDGSLPLPPAPILAVPAPVEGEEKLVWLLDSNHAVIQEIGPRLEHAGYTVRVFGDLAELTWTARRQAPAALVLDLLLAGGAEAADAVAALQKGRPARLPVIFLSARSVLGAHLQAVRAGGSAYFSKPVDTEALIDRLDELTTPLSADPYRILVVDDEPIVAKYHAGLLQAAGMRTSVVMDPMQVMAPLVDFKPDLILMDLYMDGCTGLELAALIRQQAAYVSIPIVFLSGETNTTTQLLAMQHGGDDFLTKPIQPDHLVSAVQSRVQRLRTLRSYMLRDSLTGLLNHGSIKEHLHQEVLRARRQGTPLAFAIIDIDHFKKVNDTYGHPTGDRVIKALARLLRKRLRSSDLVGRYGGEELAILFSNTRAADALHVLDELRLRFAELVHQGEEAEFRVTFSGGVAQLAPQDDALSLNDAADRALYRAKEAGRNCLRLADEEAPAPPAAPPRRPGVEAARPTGWGAGLLLRTSA